ncbi:MAG: hypothetical protein M3040_13660, partial [Bacteroidota bacterium]|nr:hypothetical protein [Bacteroidota bacterium]
DSIRVALGFSVPQGTSYLHQNFSLKAANSKLSFKKTDGNTFVSYIDTSKTLYNKPVPLDTSTMVISIYQNGYALDAKYLQAAINAIKDFLRRKFRVSVITDVQHIAADRGWLFWLSEETIPASLVKNNVFLYEKGKVENIHSTLITKDKADETVTADITLYKSVLANTLEANTFPIWKNGFGEAVLSVQKEKATVYHFYSRFNPQWSDLPWSPQFPQIILDLILPIAAQSKETNGLDKRIIDVTQIQPVITRDDGIRAKQDLLNREELSKIFWIVAFALFLLERVVSSNTKKEEVYE